MVLETITGSRLRAKVLGWLFTHPDEKFFVRQLTGLLGEDSTNLSRELSRLEETGILVSTRTGKQKYYQANRKNPLYKDLHGLMAKTAGVADILRAAVAPFSNRIKLAFIFGSMASGNEKRSSDIDVMMVGPISFSEAVSLFSTAEEKLGREVNPVVYSEIEFKKKVREDHYFVKNVVQGEKIFLLGTEDELRRLAE